ncbi:MAG: tyrosine-type recombinase/integrase [Fibrobacteria bacterium]
MKPYFYQRIDAGVRAKEWSYRLRNVPRDLPKAAWPDKFKRSGTLWTSKTATVAHVNAKIHETLQAAHEIKMGRRPADKGDIQMAKAAYIAWGKVFGGTRNEMGWTPDHAHHIAGYLDFWIGTLSIKNPSDLVDAQPAFRRELVKLRARFVPNTVNHYARALTGFTRWLHEEKSLPIQPLSFKALDRSPVNERGAFLASEVGAIMRVASTRNEVIYQTAYLTGYRKTSLKKIRVGYLDWTALTIGLDYLSTKNRKKTMKPMTARLATALYPLCQGKAPTDFIFDWFNPKQAVKALRRDMARAGVPILDPMGRRRDFHSLKASFGKALDDAGTEPKVMQQGLDHATFAQTMVYLKRELAPLRAAAEAAEAALSVSAKDPDINRPVFITEKGPMQKGAAGSTTYRERGEVPHPPRRVSDPGIF